MGQKIVIVVVILVVLLLAYQYIKSSIANATLDRELFSVLTMYKKRMEQGANMKPNVDDMRRDAYEVFKKMNIPIKPQDITIEVNFDQDFLAIRAKYPSEMSLLIYTMTSMKNVDVHLDLK